MAHNEETSEVEEGELLLDNRPVCGVRYLLSWNYRDAQEKQIQMRKYGFIGELLLMSANGEERQVNEAARQNKPFTLQLQNHVSIQILLLPEISGSGVFEMLTQAGC